ncbi:MAG: ABC transporter ATP-binding protein/permease, partial [Steroidobacteraceae bacterium]
MGSTLKAPPKKGRRAPAENDEAAQSGLFRQVGLITRAISGSGAAKTLVLLIIGLFVIIVATAYGQIRLNAWNKPFYDALSRRDLHDFLVQLGVFFIIA